MREWCVWLLLLGKRQLRRPVFLAVLALVPLACGWLLQADRQEDAGVPVALVCRQPDAMTRRAMEELCERDGEYGFYLCEEEQAARDVKARRAECAFLFPDDLERRMRDGEAEGSVTVLSSPSSVAATLAYEVVYAALFSQYAEDVFVDYMTENPLFAQEDPEQTAREARETYRSRRADGSTFAFVFEQLDADGSWPVSAAGETSWLAGPVRGLLAVYVFLGGLMGALDSLRDRRRRADLAAAPGRRRWLPLLETAVPAALTALSAGAALWAAGLGGGFLREGGLLAAYWVLVTGFCTLLADLLRRETLFCAAIPVLMLGSLLFAPVFLRLGAVAPVFRVLEKLFAPSYYLNGAAGAEGLLLAGAAVCLAAGLLSRRLDRQVV